ncbi:MerR family transcriptional regulator [Streptomyces sp. GS7]|nr:MerR family transcriptional regulator [Streptomyces sp. GS7]
MTGRPAHPPPPNSVPAGYSAGQTSAFAGITVRTLDHYDRTGPLSPDDRGPADDRHHGDAAPARLRQIRCHRHLGSPLDETAAIPEAPPPATAARHPRNRRLDQPRTRYRRPTEDTTRLQRPGEVAAP